MQKELVLGNKTLILVGKQDAILRKYDSKLALLSKNHRKYNVGLF